MIVSQNKKPNKRVNPMESRSGSDCDQVPIQPERSKLWPICECKEQMQPIGIKSEMLR